MAHFLLAWELGAGLGHLTRLRALAKALQQRGHRLSFVLKDVVTGASQLPAAWGPTLQAPVLLNEGHVTQRPAWSMADVLLGCGHASASTLTPLADAWVALLRLSACNAVVADHAPTALLAARLLGLPALHLGSGFSLPPPVAPLPVFRDWAVAPPGFGEVAEPLVLAKLNTLLNQRGQAPLAHLWELFHPAQTALCTWPELDHYAAQRPASARYLGPDCEFVPGAAPQWPLGQGPKVLAYLRAGHPEIPELLRALNASHCRTLCFMPGATAATGLPGLPNMVYSEVPLDMQSALEQASLFVGHAGHASAAQAMCKGVPCLMLPNHAEQFILARRVEACGLGINVAALAQPVDYAALIDTLLAPQGAHQVAARAFAARLLGFDPPSVGAAAADAAEALLKGTGTLPSPEFQHPERTKPVRLN